jgi:hypothetical protein
MLNLDSFTTLGKDIYLFKNFLSKKECSEIVEFIQTIPEDAWKGFFNQAGQGSEVAILSAIPQAKDINARLSSLLDKGFYLNGSTAPTRMKIGWSGAPHSDNHDFLNVLEANKNLNEHDEFVMHENNVAGLVIYFNNFDGGEIYYSSQDITYTPKAGDLIIHSSEEHCRHQVKEVKSEVRYSHSNNIFQDIKVPKGFVNVI